MYTPCPMCNSPAMTDWLNFLTFKFMEKNREISSSRQQNKTWNPPTLLKSINIREGKKMLMLNATQIWKQNFLCRFEINFSLKGEKNNQEETHSLGWDLKAYILARKWEHSQTECTGLGARSSVVFSPGEQSWEFPMTEARSPPAAWSRGPEMPSLLGHRWGQPRKQEYRVWEERKYRGEQYTLCFCFIFSRRIEILISFLLEKRNLCMTVKNVRGTTKNKNKVCNFQNNRRGEGKSRRKTQLIQQKTGEERGQEIKRKDAK